MANWILPSIRDGNVWRCLGQCMAIKAEGDLVAHSIVLPCAKQSDLATPQWLVQTHGGATRISPGLPSSTTSEDADDTMLTW